MMLGVFVWCVIKFFKKLVIMNSGVVFSMIFVLCCVDCWNVCKWVYVFGNVGLWFMVMFVVVVMMIVEIFSVLCI